MGSIIRASVEEFLTGAPDRQDAAFGIIGLIDDAGPTLHGDPAVEHDASLAGALEAEGSAIRRSPERCLARYERFVRCGANQIGPAQ